MTTTHDFPYSLSLLFLFRSVCMILEFGLSGSGIGNGAWEGLGHAYTYSPVQSFGFLAFFSE